jgi:hypothetical protein
LQSRPSKWVMLTSDFSWARPLQRYRRCPSTPLNTSLVGLNGNLARERRRSQRSPVARVRDDLIGNPSDQASEDGPRSIRSATRCTQAIDHLFGATAAPRCIAPRLEASGWYQRNCVTQDAFA